MSAYVRNNAVPGSELANMIRTTKAAPSEDAKPEAPPEPEYVPTVSVKTSLESRDHIGLLQGPARA